MRSAWLARDRMGQLALFVREAPARNSDLLEAEARVLGVTAITAFVSRGVKQPVIAARREPPVRVATEAAHVRVAAAASEPEDVTGTTRSPGRKQSSNW